MAKIRRDRESAARRAKKALRGIRWVSSDEPKNRRKSRVHAEASSAIWRKETPNGPVGAFGMFQAEYKKKQTTLQTIVTLNQRPARVPRGREEALSRDAE